VVCAGSPRRKAPPFLIVTLLTLVAWAGLLMKIIVRRMEPLASVTRAIEGAAGRGGREEGRDRYAAFVWSTDSLAAIDSKWDEE
jgi:hypothetical protein